MTDRRQTPGPDAPAATESVPETALPRRTVLASLTATALGGGFAGRTVAASRAVHAAGGEETDRIRDEAWVATAVDTDESGTADRVHVRVSRPASTADGEQYPVIATASPYYGEQTHSDSTPAMHYDRAVAPAASEVGETADGTAAGTAASARGPRHRPPPRAPLVGAQTLEQRYVPAEYVVARISALGTHRSTGCYTAAGPPTIDALASVVDWFNGRATAYASRTGDETVTADWTTGRTGLIGASANGELANGLATTGVDGLAAIVPQSANNGQYSLFRSNGTPISVVPDRSEQMADLGTWIQAGNARRSDCDHWTGVVEEGQDRATGDYNDFWHDREFLPDADAVDAAVLATHAVDDPIVKPNNVADWYEALAAADVPRRLWLHEGGHTSPRSEAFADLLDRWWDHWLKGADTGVMDEDPVTVDRGGSPGQGSVDTYADWPVPGTAPTVVGFTAGGATAGGLTLDEPQRPRSRSSTTPRSPPADSSTRPSPTTASATRRPHSGSRST